MARKRLALEIIDFQHDDTGSRLEVIFQRMIDQLRFNPRYILEGSEHDLRLCTYVKNRFGINLECRYGTLKDSTFLSGSPFFTIPFYVAPNNILGKGVSVSADVSNSEIGITKNIQGKKGTVDLEKAKVDGIFSKNTMLVYMCIPMAVRLFGFDASKITAIFLHEIGHLFTYFEYSDRLTTGNQLMLRLSTAIKNNDKKTMSYIFKELGDINNSNNTDFQDLLDEDDRVILGYKFFTLYVGKVVSSLQNGKYDSTTTEQLANSFSARFGYGLHLVEALDTLTKYKPHSSFVSKFTIVPAIISTLTTVKSMVDVYKIGVANVNVIQIMYILSSIVTHGFFYAAKIKQLQESGDHYREMGYDDIKTTYRRIRMDYIDVLKTPTLDHIQKQKIINEIKQIDTITNNTAEDKDIFVSISNKLFSKNKTTKAHIELQKMLEQLAHNDLFLKSSELSTL